MPAIKNCEVCNKPLTSVEYDNETGTYFSVHFGCKRNKWLGADPKIAAMKAEAINRAWEGRGE